MPLAPSKKQKEAHKRFLREYGNPLKLDTGNEWGTSEVPSVFDGDPYGNRLGAATKSRGDFGFSPRLGQARL